MAGKGSFIILQKENILQTQGGMGILWYYKRNSKILSWNWNGRRVMEIIQESLLGSQIPEMILMLQSAMDMKYKLMILLSQMVSLFMALGQFMILRLHPQ